MNVKRVALGASIVIVLIAMLGIWIYGPQMRQAIAFPSIEWSSAGASFSVTEIVSSRIQDQPALQIYCRWATDKGAENFALGFPDAPVAVSPSAKLRTGASPIGQRDFVIHLPLERTPFPLATIAIPINCSQVEDQQDLGTQSLIVRYWPSSKNDIDVNEIQ